MHLRYFIVLDPSEQRGVLIFGLSFSALTLERTTLILRYEYEHLFLSPLLVSRMPTYCLVDFLCMLTYLIPCILITHVDN
jgi:hypothetical protein